MLNRVAFVILSAAAIVSGTFSAEARPQYARREGVNCGYCHLSASGGGERGFRGMFYGANGLSFDGFEELRESMLAGVEKNAMAGSTMPKFSYCGSIAGPGAPQIQLMALSVPVVVVWLDAATIEAKAFAAKLSSLKKAFGRNAGVLGVARSDSMAALKLTSDLGNPFRVLPDPNGTSIKKFAPTAALDFALVSRGGKLVKLWQGYGASNLSELNAELANMQLAARIDAAGAPSSPVRGAKLAAR